MQAVCLLEDESLEDCGFLIIEEEKREGRLPPGGSIPVKYHAAVFVGME
jgi:hypothetical protein